MPGRPDINPVIAQATADTPGALPVYGGRDGQTITGYQVPQNVGSPPATQAEIDNANAMADRISKAVGTTVDLVYPNTRMVHDGNFAPDYSAAPIGFRFDNGQSQYVNIDLNGQVTGVQQRGGGLAAVLPFIEKAVEFVFPATIPFIEGANALYAASQGNIAGALASAANMGIQVPGVDTSSFKSVTNYVNGANALAKGDIGGLVNAVGNATDDPSLKADLKTAATDLGIAQAVAGGNPMAALKSVMGSAGSSGSNSAINNAITQEDLDAEEARLDAQFKAQRENQAAAEKALEPQTAFDASSVAPTEAELQKQYSNAAATDAGGLSTLSEDKSIAGNESLVDQVAGWNPNKTTMSGGEQTASADESGLPVSSDILDRATQFQPVDIAGKQLTADELPALPDVSPLGSYVDNALNPVTITGSKGNNTITDSGLPVDQNIGTTNASTELAPVDVTGTRGNNLITDSGLPVDANVGYNAPDNTLAPVEVAGKKLTADQLPDLPDVSPLSAFAGTELAPVTVTGQRNSITDSGLPVDANVGLHNEESALSPVTVTGKKEDPLTVDQLPDLPAVSPLSTLSTGELNPVTITGKKEEPLTVDQLPDLPNASPLSAFTSGELAPVTVTGKKEEPLTVDQLPDLPEVSPLSQFPTGELNPVTVTGKKEEPLTVDQLPELPAVTQLDSVNQNVLPTVTVTGKKEEPLTVDQLPDLPNVSPLSTLTSNELTPVTVTGKKEEPLTLDQLPDLPNVSPLSTLDTTELNPVTITGKKELPLTVDELPDLPNVTPLGTYSTELDPVTITGKKEPLTVDELPPLPDVTPLPTVIIPESPVVKPKVVTPTVTPKVTPPVEPPASSGGLPTYNDLAGIAGKVLTLGQMGKLMKYEQNLKQLGVPTEQRWSDMQDMAIQNADVNKALAALAQYAPDAEKDVVPSFYAHGGGVQNFDEGGKATSAADLLAAYNQKDISDALKNLGNIGSGLEPLKSKVLQLGQMGSPSQQRPLQQMTVIPQLAALLQSRGMKLAGGGRADHEHPEYDGIPVFRTGGLEGLGGKYVEGKGDGTSDDITAMLANGEYVFSADVVAALGNGSNKAGAKELDQMVQAIRSRARSAPPDRLPPDAKSPLEYLKSSKGKKHG